ncbi:arylsulfatase [Sedimentisphaera salicampi]|uniref:arylsulfatase n=1 Tax=Sedimentisphaera salicampi TaxID=1941349 RepID=UPI000B9BE406|nr:arylsulfatase [Sedimentisphaera salicampi]OXU15554.1 Arylsulfatase [Sedimentisphaera salicampi]
MKSNKITRRKFLGLAAIVGAGAGYHWGLSSKADSSALGKPNIIFVMLDDMGYGDLGLYGQNRIRMPHIDQMAREGIRFTQVYSGATICAPARSTLMTGQHTGRTTVRGNWGDLEHGAVPCSGGSGPRVPLKEDDVTIAEVLKDAGYATGITGKWGLGEPDTSGLPNRQGFDEWFGYLNQHLAHSHYPEYLWDNQKKKKLNGNRGTTKNFANQSHYSHDLFTDFAMDFIKRRGAGEAPFFLYVPYCLPHDSFQIPEIESYADEAGWSKVEKIYASMLTRVDRDMGRMFSLLREMGIDKDTIVFFCSDNGAANRYEGTFNSSGPLRGKKRSLYDGGLRTAMVVRWPGRIKAGAVSDDIWYFPDVLPTFAELAGASLPNNIDGVSVVPSLLSQPQPELQSRPLYWEDHERGFRCAARKGDWKFVCNGLDKPVEVYNLADDIGEEENLAESNPELVKWLWDFLKQSHTPSANWPVPKLDQDDGKI